MVSLSRDGYEKSDVIQMPIGEPIVEMKGVRISYGKNSVLGDWQQATNGSPKEGLYWNVHRGQRWGIFGANGSGKTTLLSLVTSDHPQTYSAPIKLFNDQDYHSLAYLELQSSISSRAWATHHQRYTLFSQRD